MLIELHPHAFKHGLQAEQILTAYDTAVDGAVIRQRDKDSWPPRWATIGFDLEGRAIELVFVKLIDQRILIFHARYATKGFINEIRGLK